MYPREDSGFNFQHELTLPKLFAMALVRVKICAAKYFQKILFGISKRMPEIHFTFVQPE